ncbi:MAG: M20 family peptidase [Pseudomonadales bacterium]|nr:M20 family peptidase [Pseudomonadales bacterium]
MKKIALTLLVITLILVVCIGVNTLQFTSKQPNVASIDGIEVNTARAVQTLSAAIKLETISHQNSKDAVDQPFFELAQLISDRFPAVAQNLQKTVINKKSLLYKWQGKNSQLKPITFLAHLDVVPAEQGTLDQWKYPPFSGVIAEGFVWGRGTLDDKSSVLGTLEAVEHLIESGFAPNRTVYLAFGHDEEIGGKQGAAKIAEYMAQQGINSLFTLDEGMVVLNKQLSPAGKDTAIIGIAEKGYVTLRLTAHAEGGHSSMPTSTGAIGILAGAITALEQNQRPSKFADTVEETFSFLGPEMGLVDRIMFANQWLFGSAIISALERKTSTAAMIRSTTAITMIEGGFKENAIPSQASATVNFRILPGESSAEIKKHVERVIANPAISVDFITNSTPTEPSKISAADTTGFSTIGRTAQQLFPGAIFAPGLVLAGTDSVNYQNSAENNYRFAPYVLGPDDLGRIHGINERIRIEDYGLMIKFYAQLIINMDE